MSTHIFREYDIRGVADRDLGDDVAKKIGHGLARMLKPTEKNDAPRIVVCRDCRRSGPRLFEALVGGLVDAGADVVDVGVGPTPLMYFGVHHLDADGGVMITGSHNPGDENGFKIMKGKASFFGADIQKLRERVEAGTAPPIGPRGSLQTIPIHDDYLDEMRQAVKLARTDVGVVIDAGNGSAGPLGLKALRATGLDPVPLYCEMNGSFPNHHPDPTVPKNLETLIATVKEKEARVGVAWDGDGDRLGVVDATGEIVWGDRLLALFARDVLKQHSGAAVIGEVKCSQSTYDDVARHGGRPIMWKTGHSLIKTKMKEEKALLAGEMSGHFFFADRYYGYDDGIYAALRLLEIVCREDKTVVELLRDLPQGVSTPEIRVDCPDALKVAVVAGVKRRLAESGKLTDIDGVRVAYEDGSWFLVRASNTGPVIVMRFEAPNEARLSELRREVDAALEASKREAERAS
jgi:phosphomannomutase/phosphoglucomutase